MATTNAVDGERLRKMDREEIACFRAVVATFAQTWLAAVSGGYSGTPSGNAALAAGTVGASYAIDSIPKWLTPSRRFYDVESYAILFAQARLFHQPMAEYFTQQGVV